MVHRLILLLLLLPLSGGVHAAAVIFTYTQNDNTGNNIALGYAVPLPVASLTAVDGFRAYDELHNQHEFLAMFNANVDSRVAGKTLKGENIFAYVIGDANVTTVHDSVPEAAVMITGGTHPREWQPPEVVTELLEQLVEIKDDNSIGSYLRDNVTIVLIPVLNVDSFRQTQLFPTQVTSSVATPREGRMRRKNLRALDGTNTAVDGDLFTSGDNLKGVDLNRNNSVGFGLNGGSSTAPGSLVYRGPQPATEPEIQALQAAAEFGPASRLRMHSDTHAFSQIFFTPMTTNTRRNTLTAALTHVMRRVTGLRYRYGPSTIAGDIGTTSDWFAETYQIPSWTLETEPLNGGQDYGGTGASHSGFILPDSEIARVRDELAKVYIFGTYRQAGPPSIRAAKIFDRTNGNLMYSATWDNTSGFQRNLNVDTNKALIPGGRYTLWVAFDKPMRVRNAGSVVQFEGQAVTLLPTIYLETPDTATTRFRINTKPQLADWREFIGPAPDNALRYADDSIRTSFDVPASLAGSGTQSLALAVDVTDLSGQQIDANPQTVVDWRNGHWFNYEDSGFQNSEFGGIDCTNRPFIADDSNAAAPSPTGDCRVVAAAKSAAAPVSNTPSNAPTASGRGGGGGSFGLLFLVLLSLLAMVGRKRD